MLTGNDVALAQMSVQMTMAWWSKQEPSDYGREQTRRLGELRDKLDRILNRAYPDIEEPKHDGGDESVLIFDPAMDDYLHLRAMGALPL